MNPRRVATGGIAAGAILATGGAGLGRFLAESGWADPTPRAVVILRAMILGIGCVLLYALIIPRLGAGMKTAATAGLLVFLVGVLFPPFGISMNGAFEARLLLYSVIWNAVLIPVAAMAGGALYRELEESQARI